MNPEFKKPEKIEDLPISQVIGPKGLSDWWKPIEKLIDLKIKPGAYTILGCYNLIKNCANEIDKVAKNVENIDVGITSLNNIANYLNDFFEENVFRSILDVTGALIIKNPDKGVLIFLKENKITRKQLYVYFCMPLFLFIMENIEKKYTSVRKSRKTEESIEQLKLSTKTIRDSFPVDLTHTHIRRK